MKDTFPGYLASYADLRDHFERNFTGLSPRDRGVRFAKVVQGVVPYTAFGSRGFNAPELQQESHDEGVDLIADHGSSREILCIQAKYTLKDKIDFDGVISKFRGFHQRHYADTAPPLFAHGGVALEDEPTVYFQLVAGNSVSVTLVL